MSFLGSGTPSGFSFASGDQGQPPQQVRFGSPAPAQSGFTFGTPTQGAAAPLTGLFGTVSTTPQQQQQQTLNAGFTFGGSQVTTAVPTATSGTGFTFGTPNTSVAPSSTFGTRFGALPVTPSVNTASPMASIFSGTAAAAPTATANTGFSFGPTTTAATSSPFASGFTAKPASVISFPTPGTGLTFGQTPASTTTAATSGSFGISGLTPTASLPAFGMPQMNQTNPVLTTATSAPGFVTLTTTPNTGFNFGGTAATTSQNKGFTFGAATSTTATTTAPVIATPSTGGITFVSTPVCAPQTNLFGLPASGGLANVPTGNAKIWAVGSNPDTSKAGGLTFGLAKTTTTTATTSTLFGLTATTSSTPATTASAPAATTTAGFSFGVVSKPPTTTATGLLVTPVLQSTVAPTATGQVTLSLASSTVPTTQAALTTTTTTTIASITTVPSAATINYRKLEEEINKWTVELEEQERVFLSQATQVNAWDRILILNGDKITHLNDVLERVKLDQEHLDQEIDFIHSQQNELEELLTPLEKSVETLPILSIHQHADLEREQTFQMAENIDSQLRLMSRDLQDVIEHLNSTSGAQDSNDPIQQIGKILNSHMDSLQWIDQNTNVLRKKVDDVARVYEACRQDQEKGLQLPYM